MGVFVLFYVVFWWGGGGELRMKCYQVHILLGFVTIKLLALSVLSS